MILINLLSPLASGATFLILRELEPLCQERVDRLSPAAQCVLVAAAIGWFAFGIYLTYTAWTGYAFYIKKDNFLICLSLSRNDDAVVVGVAASFFAGLPVFGFARGALQAIFGD